MMPKNPSELWHLTRGSPSFSLNHPFQVSFPFPLLKPKPKPSAIASSLGKLGEPIEEMEKEEDDVHRRENGDICVGPRCLNAHKIGNYEGGKGEWKNEVSGKEKKL